MYYQFFGLTKNPFSMTPDPSSLFLTDAHREAIAGLSYGAFSRKGFVVLTGEAGTGKTTLLRRLVELSKESNARCSVVFNPLLSPAEFLELLLFNFGLRDMPASKTQRLLKLEELLLDTHKARKTAVLIVDEAHKLSHEVFEEIRLLTNFETGDDKLLQIVLAGQPELKGVLSHPDLWQLKQRIAVRLNINPLAARQVGNFIAYRWSRFGGADPHPFTADAVALIAQWSRGIPRLVNSICDNALLLAYSQQSRAVRADEILEVARDLDLPVPLEPLEMEREIAASPGPVSETNPPGPTVNGNGNGHSNGNGHKLSYSNGHALDALHRVSQQVEQHSVEPPTKPAPAPTRPDLPAESERVRAQAATRPRPSVFQRAERNSPNTPLFPAPQAAATPAPVATNTLREIVRVKKLARSEAPAPKVSRLMGWLIRVGLVTIHANGHWTISLAGLWRNK
jgi:general secretion pathway protein A